MSRTDERDDAVKLAHGVCPEFFKLSGGEPGDMAICSCRHKESTQRWPGHAAIDLVYAKATWVALDWAAKNQGTMLTLSAESAKDEVERLEKVSGE